MRAAQPRVVFVARRSMFTSSDARDIHQRLSNPNSGVDEIMSTWIKYKGSINDFELLRFVWNLRRSNDCVNALKLMDWMGNQRLNTSSSYHALRLELIADVKGIDMAENYYASLHDDIENPKIYGALLNSYCQHKMEEKAITLFSKMKELKLDKAWDYNYMMLLFMKLGDPRKMFTYYQEMRAADIPPDMSTFKYLCCISLDDIISVEEVIKEMEDAKVKVTWKMYMDMVFYYKSEGAIDKTLIAIKKAEENMDRRNRVFYYSLITCYAEAGNLTETMRMWRLLESSFPKLTNNCYYNIIGALKILKDFDGMKYLFEEWELECISYDVKLLNLMMEASLNSRNVNEVERLKRKGIHMGFDLNLETGLFIDYNL